MENMFVQWLADHGAELEAMIFRSPNDWCPDQYIFRFRLNERATSGSSDLVIHGAWSSAHIIPWGIGTFARVTEIITEARS